MEVKKNFIVKVIAVILFGVMFTTAFLSSVCIAFGIGTGAFSDEKVRKEYRDGLCQDLLSTVGGNFYSAIHSYHYDESQDKKFDYESINLSHNYVYEIEDDEGNLIYSNVNVPVSDVCNVKAYEIFGEATTQTHLSADGTEYFTSVDNIVEVYYVNLYIVKDVKENDTVQMGLSLFDFVADNSKLIIAAAALSFIITIVLMIFILCSAGHKEDIEGIHISRFDKLPIDIMSAIYIGLSALLGCGIGYFMQTTFDVVYSADSVAASIMFALGLLIIVGIVLDFILLAVLLMTTAVRLKTRTFIKTTAIYFVLKLLWKIVKVIFNKLKKSGRTTVSFIAKIPLVWKTILAIILLVFCEIHIVIMMGSFLEELGYILFVIFNALLLAVVLYVAIQLKTIKNTTKEIAKGNIYQKIDTTHMFLDIKEHAENINNINDGIATAVQDRMKSERFKTELITNVSHDIKTPLTSIINYVDLLEKEEIENETAKEYVGVLSRQSIRLKKLIDDLLEASKASTGNINVNFAKCELGILVSQALGEYLEKFDKNNLQVVLNKPEDALYIMADNRHLWRIFDNVLNNIAKYAQPSTRVYIDLKKNYNNAEISFRNISKEPLNISGDELMERFVRGDSSRNTEGSGLGLSIAKSLAEVQNGKLYIDIDGDLFKVKLSFSISE